VKTLRTVLACFAVLACQGLLPTTITANDRPTFTADQLKLPGKKGVGMALREPGSVSIVRALNPSWNYSWTMSPAREIPGTIEFVPMAFRGTDQRKLRDQLIKNALPQIRYGKAKRLLGFNEPDKANQANMPFMKAIELWPDLEKLGVPLCSPSCANPEGIQDPSAQGVAGTWMRDFMTEADKRGYRIDYIGVHWYGDTSAIRFKAKMQRIHELYGKRPLLITEFAPADWQTGGDITKHRHKPEDVLAFMKEVVPWMEQQDWIAGYAWFPFAIDSPQGTSSALFDTSGKLTRLGEFYSTVTPRNPSGNQTIEIQRAK
jgi:hypothetical protein